MVGFISNLCREGGESHDDGLMPRNSVVGRPNSTVDLFAASIDIMGQWEDGNVLLRKPQFLKSRDFAINSNSTAFKSLLFTPYSSATSPV